MYDFKAINKRLTFTLSKALALVCNVFCPYTTMPVPGKVAIGFTFPLYKVSLFEAESFCSTLTTCDSPPLFIPAGANQGSATESL